MDNISDILRSVFGISRMRYKGNIPILLHYSRDTLGKIYQEAGFTVGAEIGVKKGDYSEIICKQVPDLTYYCVDMWDLVEDKYQHRRRRYLRKAQQVLSPYNVKFIKKKSLDAVKDFEDRSLDFVYIDADHTFDNVVQDIIQWSAKVKHGGIIAGHDYFQHIYGGVVPAVDAYTRCHRIHPWYVTYEIAPSFFWVNP